MYDRILLTLDGSERSRAAIPHAAALASGGAAEAYVLSVIEPLDAVQRRTLVEAYEFHSGDPERIREIATSRYNVHRNAAEDELHRAAEQLKAAGLTTVHEELREGEPGNVIVDTAQEVGAGAIVMATRGHGGLGREILGSVAEYVLRHAGDTAVVMTGTRASAKA